MKVPSSVLHSARRVLGDLSRRALEALGSEPAHRVVRRLNANARRLTVTSPNGQPYSGVLAIEANQVVTGVAVPCTGAAPTCTGVHRGETGAAPWLPTKGDR